MSKLSVKGLIVVALALSLVTSMLVYNYLKGASQKTFKEGMTVVVAKMDIPPKTKIVPEMVQEMKMPAEYMQPGIVTEMKSVIGVVTREKLIAGEQITERRLLLEGKSAGFTGIIPPNMRAVTVAVTEVTGVAGFVKAGDYVDVVAIFDKNDTGEHAGNLILQNVLVLAANHETELGNPEAASKDKKDVVKTATVTLAVSPDEAPKLAVSEEKGKIRLALRPFMPEIGIAFTQAATPTELVGFHQPPRVNNGSGGGGATAERATDKQQAPPITKGITIIRGTKVEVVPIY